MSSDAHVPVLLGPVLEGLNIKEEGIYVDGTFGRGGHSGRILGELGREGRLLAIDRDPAAIAAAPGELLGDPRFELVHGEIADLEKLLATRDLVGRVDGMLLDLGVSSPQLDDARRGFSFLRDGPLDMRMDDSQGQTAAEWLATIDEKSLSKTIYNYGEDKMARRIARAIVSARAKSPLTRTGELARIVEDAVPAKFKQQRRHPATRTFQAIRIAVNSELEQLEQALLQSLRILGKGGRLCVIAFHSLEDRLVKRFMRDNARETEQYRGMPDIPAEFRPPLRLVGRAIAADAAEIAMNVRARSAHLRIAERT